MLTTLAVAVVIALGIVTAMAALLALFTTTAAIGDVDPGRCGCEACLRELPEWHLLTADERTYGAERRAT